MFLGFFHCSFGLQTELSKEEPAEETADEVYGEPDPGDNYDFGEVIRVCIMNMIMFTATQSTGVQQRLDLLSPEARMAKQLEDELKKLNISELRSNVC